MTCCIELDTPNTILKDGNDYYDAGTDIFAVISESTDSTFENTNLMCKALWWRYRNYLIGACDTEFWVQGMADRLDMIGARWDEIFTKMSETDMTDLTDRSYDREIKREAIEGTQGDVRTISHTGSDTHTMEHEALPQTASGTTQYLDARQKDTTTPGVTDTDTYKPNTKDTEHYDEYTAPNAVTFAMMVEAYPNVLIDFTEEFREYFVDRWY